MQRVFVVFLSALMGLSVGVLGRVLTDGPESGNTDTEVALVGVDDIEDGTANGGDDAANGGDDAAGTSTGTTATTTTAVTTTTGPAADHGDDGICIDDTESWNWPTTTEGPVIDCPASPFGVPDYPLAPVSVGWIAVLDSVDINDPGRVNEAMSILARVTDPRLLDSRMHLGLRDPYWVIFTGPFASRDAASDYCVNNPQLVTCYPRELIQ